jgi:hypothetical protein
MTLLEFIDKHWLGVGLLVFFTLAVVESVLLTWVRRK